MRAGTFSPPLLLVHNYISNFPVPAPGIPHFADELLHRALEWGGEEARRERAMSVAGFKISLLRAKKSRKTFSPLLTRFSPRFVSAPPGLPYSFRLLRYTTAFTLPLAIRRRGEYFHWEQAFYVIEMVSARVTCASHESPEHFSPLAFAWSTLDRNTTRVRRTGEARRRQNGSRTESYETRRSVFHALLRRISDATVSLTR